MLYPLSYEGGTRGVACRTPRRRGWPLRAWAVVSVRGGSAGPGVTRKAGEGSHAGCRLRRQVGPQNRRDSGCDSQDPQSSGSLAGLRRSVKPPTVLTAVQYSQGGHNTSDWSNELPADFQWLTHRLAPIAG